MRRGFMEWSKEELPPAVIEGRIADLRNAMQEAGLDAFIAYTNLTRPGTVAHFAVFTPYWSDGLLVVPREGPTTLAVALSNRMKNWIHSTAHVDDIACGPRTGRMAADALKPQAPKRIGVVELDQLPAGIARDLQDGLDGAVLIDATALATGLRGRSDAAEIGLAAQAAAIARAAFEGGLATTQSDAGALLGEIERRARIAGAEEIYLAAAPDLAADARLSRLSAPVPLGPRFAVRASLAYKGVWIRLTRTIDRSESGGAMSAVTEARFRAALATLRGGQKIGPTLRFAFPAVTDWLAEGTIGSQPLQVLGSEKWRPDFAPPPQALATITLRLSLAEGPWIGACPVVIGEGAADGRVLV
jgi:hypothetical protein